MIRFLPPRWIRTGGTMDEHGLTRIPAGSEEDPIVFLNHFSLSVFIGVHPWLIFFPTHVSYRLPPMNSRNSESVGTYA